MFLGEMLYSGMRARGRVPPGFALNAERVPCETVFFWKPVSAAA
jgi:hypothetical protein